MAASDVFVALHYTDPDTDAEHGEYVGHKPDSRLQDVRISCECLIKNGRAKLDASGHPALRLSTTGFELRKVGPSRVRDFLDDSEVLAVYVPEVEAIVREKGLKDTSIRAVAVWDLAKRSSAIQNELQEAKSDATIDLLAPVGVVHADFHPGFAATRLRQRVLRKTDTLNPVAFDLVLSEETLLGEYAEGKLPFLSVNVWRSIDRTNEVKQHPLALCAPQSIYCCAGEEPSAPSAKRCRQSPCKTRASGGIPFEINCPDVTIVETHFAPGVGHDWHYYPDMSAEECIVFISHDSASNAEPVPHASFQLPLEKDAPPRQSIEARVFVFLDNGSIVQ